MTRATLHLHLPRPSGGWQRVSFATFRMYTLVLLWISAAILTACASKAPTPDWQINAPIALQNAQQALLEGNTKVYDAQVRQLRLAVSSSGQPAALAQVELALCAAQSASLTLVEPIAPFCPAFTLLRADATPAQQAYFLYLTGQPLGAADAALLPTTQQPFVSVAAGGGSVAALQAVNDPLSRLVAAWRLMLTNRLDANGIALAVQTASTQGWRRALIGWLTVAVRDAANRGDTAAADRYQRQLDVALSLGQPARPSGSAPTAPPTKD